MSRHGRTVSHCKDATLAEFSAFSREDTYLGIIGLGVAEESLERIVAGDGEAGDIDEELSGNVEKDKEEVESSDAEDGVDLGDVGLLLEVVEDRVSGELQTSGSAIVDGWRESGGDRW